MIYTDGRMVILSVFLGVLCGVPCVSAQTADNGLVISPVFQEVTVEKGDAGADFMVVLTNNTTTPVTIFSSVVDFGSLDESGGVAFLGEAEDLEQKYALASWMHPEKDTIFLAAGEKEELRIVVENRESLSPGGHYGAIVFRVSNEVSDSDAENRVAINQLFSSLVFVKKKGGEIYQLDFKAATSSKQPFAVPKNIDIRFQNKGNVHIVPRGIVTILDPLKRVVKRGVINPESTLMLPETLRVYPTKIDTVRRSFFPGRYTINIAYRYEGKDDFETTSSQLFLLPPLPMVLFAAVGGMLFGWFRFRRYKKVL